MKRIEWADSDINNDSGMGEQCTGLVFEAPDGGTVYWQTVIGGRPKGDSFDQPEDAAASKVRDLASGSMMA